MRRVARAWLGALTCVLLTGFLGPSERMHAQAASSQPPKPGGMRQAVRFARSARARDLPPTAPRAAADRDRRRARTIPNREVPKAVAGKSEDLDAARQMVFTRAKMPSPLTSFEGISNDDNQNVIGSRINPPDANGDVGPHHYVQQTNLLVRVFSKDGAPLAAPFTLSSLFAPLGGLCATSDDGDPIVLYDALADRWLLSQIAYTSIISPPYHECVAISQTSDPAGAYFLYDFELPGTDFPDYPKLAVWPDAYYMTSVQFQVGGSFNGAGAFAFQREKMLSGDPSASLVYFSLDLSAYPEGIVGLLAADHDGLVPPPAGAPNPMAYFVATEFSDALDGLRLFDFHVDFANPAASTFLERAGSPLPVAAFNPSSLPGPDIPQPPPAGDFEKLDAIGDRLMHRLQHRNRGGFESLVVNHTVDGDPGTGYLAAVRWYELRTSGLGGPYAVHDQATFAPDTVHRWMGSAAIDHAGNLAVGYSASSTSVFPSIRYAGRLATDPPGGLFQGETTLMEGTGVQTTTTGRWGDYTGLTVDESDGCTFFYTNQYYSAASQASSPIGWRTRVAAFRFPGCSAPPAGTLAVNVTTCETGLQVDTASVRLEGVLYGVSNTAGALVARAAPGVHTVAASKSGRVGTASANVVDGAATPVDVCISGLLPDLAIAARLPGEAAAGDAIAITSRIRNRGVVQAGATTTGYFLSLDRKLDAGDTQIGTAAAQPVAINELVIATTSVSIPVKTAPAIYYVIAETDSLDVEVEVNEENNTSVNRLVVGPDLVLSALAVPATAAAGSAMLIEETTGNIGGGNARASATKYYLSRNPRVDTSDVLLGLHAVPRLRPGRTHSATTVVTLPADTASGTYYLIAVADADTRVEEAREGNNDKRVEITVGG